MVARVERRRAGAAPGAEVTSSLSAAGVVRGAGTEEAAGLERVWERVRRVLMVAEGVRGLSAYSASDMSSSSASSGSSSWW